MNRRQFLQAGAGLMLGGLTPAWSGCGRSRPRHLLFVVIEDWNPQAVGCYGNPLVHTPRFDALAASSVRFARAYCQAPICNPSRSSFLTGLRPETTRVRRNEDPMDQWLPPGTRSLPELLKAAGTHTIDVGKIFHRASIAGPQMRSFDRIEGVARPSGYAGVSTGYPDAAPPVPPEERARSADPELVQAVREARGLRDRLEPAGPAWREANYQLKRLVAELTGDSGETEEQSLDGQAARLAARILRERAADARPFLLALGFSKPHTPLLAPARYGELYDPAALPMPASLDFDRDVVWLGRRANTEIFGLREPTPERVRRAIASYYACVSFVDAQLGIVLDALEETGLAEQTLVVVFADHGFQLGEHGLWGKSTLFEQSTRVPLVLRVPGARGNGRVCDEIVELVDLLPTLCDLLGIEPPQNLESTSFAPLLEDPDRPWKPAAFTSRAGLGRSLGTRRYRWTEWRTPDLAGYELFDLETDPWEHVNLANHFAYRELARELHAQLETGWRAARPPRA